MYPTHNGFKKRRKMSNPNPFLFGGKPYAIVVPHRTVRRGGPKNGVTIGFADVATSREQLQNLLPVSFVCVTVHHLHERRTPHTSIGRHDDVSATPTTHVSNPTPPETLPLIGITRKASLQLTTSSSSHSLPRLLPPLRRNPATGFSTDVMQGSRCERVADPICGLRLSTAAAPVPPPSPTLSINISAEPPEKRVRHLISENPVVIFSRASCCLCHVVKRLLATLGVHPIVVELDDAEAATVSFNGMSLGQVAPAIFIGGKLVGRVESLMALHLSGQLVPELNEAGAVWV